jgi:hypothetical protein
MVQAALANSNGAPALASRAPSAAMSGSRSTSSACSSDGNTVAAAQVAVPGPAPRSSTVLGTQPGLSERSSDSTVQLAANVAGARVAR